MNRAGWPIDMNVRPVGRVVGPTTAMAEHMPVNMTAQMSVDLGSCLWGCVGPNGRSGLHRPIESAARSSHSRCAA
ncbi:hypothethical protein (plasmid) [Ralstonia solanacearum CMR15]|nr:hypothethical protein [Ralstonia solanacearum CMR15]